jgi:16S rRNA (guanine966-N2)-methyltransferase
MRLVGPLDYEGTRPISDRAKEALMSILGPRLPGSRVLDLFAGVGNVGIEALSRGAEHATFVDLEPGPVRDIRRNLEKTRLAEAATVVQADALDYLRHPNTRPFDIVFCGPPQWLGLWETTARALDERPELIAPAGVAVIQCDRSEWRRPDLTSLAVTDERRYGSVLLAFLSPA